MIMLENAASSTGVCRTPAAARGSYTVLLVEDEVLIRLMVAGELRERGFNVIEATDARKAIALLQSQGPIDLLFTDVQLPGAIDGLALARLTREMYPELKIVVGSGHLPTGGGLEIAHAVFSKPYPLDRLVRGVEELLRGTQT